MIRTQLPDWVEEPLRNDIEETTSLLTDEASSLWVTQRERGRQAREKHVREMKYELDVLLRLLRDSRSEAVFGELSDIALKEHQKPKKEYIPYTQLVIARTIKKSLKSGEISRPKALEDWESDVERCTTELIRLLRACPPEKNHIKFFNPKTIRSLVNPSRHQRFLKVLEMVCEIDEDEKSRGALLENVEELFYEEGERLEDQFTLIELLQWLLQSGQIQVGKAVGTKTKGLLAERAYFVRSFSDNWKKNRYSLSGCPPNRLIADLTSIIFPPIDEQGVSRLLTKWK